MLFRSDGIFLAHGICLMETERNVLKLDIFKKPNKAMLDVSNLWAMDQVQLIMLCGWESDVKVSSSPQPLTEIVWNLLLEEFPFLHPSSGDSRNAWRLQSGLVLLLLKIMIFIQLEVGSAS